MHPEAEHLIPEAVLGLPLEVDSLPPAIMGRTTLDEPLTQAGIDPMRSALS